MKSEIKNGFSLIGFGFIVNEKKKDTGGQAATREVDSLMTIKQKGRLKRINIQRLRIHIGKVE